MGIRTGRPIASRYAPGKARIHSKGAGVSLFQDWPRRERWLAYAVLIGLCCWIYFETI
jgi:hypothetical protein